MFKKRGFTLIELVMVISILGILAVVAIPRFIDLREDARTAARAGVEASVESGAQIWHAKYLIDSSAPYSTHYPSNWENCLDSNITSDINSKYTIGYDSTKGQVTSITGG